MTSHQRQGGLDGLRGLAALCVFSIHLWIYQLPDTFKLSRDSLAKLVLFETRVAFVLFFVLSGYLLYRPFVRAALGYSPPQSVRSYLVRRAARIMPAYYVALAGTVLLLAAAGDVTGKRLVDATEFPVFLVFGQNYLPETLLHLNAATWTLAVEVAFYLLLPVVYVLGLRRWAGSARAQAGLLASLVVVGIGWNIVAWSAGWGVIASHSPPSFLPYFACGMMVALIVESRRGRGLPRFGRRASVVLVAAGMVLLVANGYWHATDRTPDGFWIEALADLGSALGFSAIITALVLGTGTGVRWVGVRPLAWVGQISYGFYLWHIPLIVFARGRGLLAGGPVLDVLAVLPLGIAMGAASWYLIEQPVMRRASGLRRTTTTAEHSPRRVSLRRAREILAFRA